MNDRLQGFDQVYLVDFEFQCADGETPEPICLVAREFYSGQQRRLWGDDLRRLREPPYPIGEDSLFVAYYASAEIGCHLALGWPTPENVLDLYPEFRNLTNGRPVSCGSGLLGAMAFFGLDVLGSAEKEIMRGLALRGGPWTPEERAALLDYCESDVDCLARLLPVMRKHLDLPRALLRGRYMTAAARIERAGVPIDVSTFQTITREFDDIRRSLIDSIDRDFGVYDGSTFKSKLWERYLTRHGIPWPRRATGALALDDDTFKQMAAIHPQIAPIRELRSSLSKTRLTSLTIGRDGRNRMLLSAFRSRTGRNQPSNSKFIFGPAVWLRSLIRPQPGRGLAYIDWSQQEFGIAAALSGDANMIAAYRSGDCYLEFAKQSRSVPADATKRTHAQAREQFKQCVLGVQYAMGAESLAVRIARSPARARELLRLHKQAYPTFWRWSDAAVDHAMLQGRLWTVFGWNLYSDTDSNVRSFRNFPMQGNGAEMLRLACCLATERGIRVCAPVHDALLIEAPLAGLDSAIRDTQRAMAEASRRVLGDFELRSDATVVRFPERFADPRGERMWNAVMNALGSRGSA